MASRSLGTMNVFPINTFGPHSPNFSNKWHHSLVGSVGEQKWILVWAKAGDVGDSHLWGRLLGFKCESAKVLHRLGMEEMEGL